MSASSDALIEPANNFTSKNTPSFPTGPGKARLLTNVVLPRAAQQYDAVVLESHVDGWECKSENGSCLGGKYRAELVSLHHEPIRANHVSRHSATSACPRPLSSSAGVPVVTAGWPPLVTKLCNCTPVNLIARCVVYKHRRHVQPKRDGHGLQA